MRRLLDARVADIDRTIADLHALRAVLVDAGRRADAAVLEAAAVCPIIDAPA